MALMDNIGSTLGKVLNSTLGVTVVIICVVIGAAIIGVLIVLYLRAKRYKQFRCIIFEKDGFGKEQLDFDDAGVFVDSKTNNKRFFLKKHNVGLNPDKIPALKTTGKSRIVFLERTGLKNFQFINFSFKERVGIKVGEEDVNWAVNAYERQKRLFGANTLLQYMPFILMAFVCIIILIIFIYFFRGFGDLRAFADAMQEAMKYYAQAKAGTTIVGG